MKSIEEIRRTGQSTALALGYLKSAIENPNTSYKIKDHFGSRKADKLLFDTIRDMTQRLGLEIEFSLLDLTILCKPRGIIIFDDGTYAEIKGKL